MRERRNGGRKKDGKIERKKDRKIGREKERHTKNDKESHGMAKNDEARKR